MREILFRGKRVDNGEWVYGYYCPVVRGKFPATPCIVPDCDGVWEGVPIIPETVGQYTGLNDKNDEKIFDKHIVKICGGHNFYGEIIYSNDTASYWIENKRLEYYIQLGDIKPSYIEVIENVIDNPELLEVK